MKQCSICKILKSMDDFHKLSKSKDGRRSQCKMCRKTSEAPRKDYKKAWHKENAGRRLEAMKEYAQEHKEEIKQYKKIWYQNNKEKLLHQQKEKYHQNKEVIAPKAKLYYESVKMTEWYKNSTAKSQRNWISKNKHIRAWRNILHRTVKFTKSQKASSTLTLLGYSALELKTHIESLWLPLMSWENYGEWHIDHIRPLITFDPNDSIREINALSNLRPLWSTTRTIDDITYEGNLNRRKKHD